MIDNIRTVFTYELWRNLRRRAFLLTTFGIPVFAFGFFAIVQVLADVDIDLGGTATTETFAGYVDYSGLFPESGDLLDYDSEDAAQQALDEGEIDRYYVIAEDYAETGDVIMVIPGFSFENVDSNMFDAMLYSQFAEDIDPLTALRLRVPATVETIEFERVADGEAVDTEGEASNDMSEFWMVYVFAIVMMFAIFGTNGYLMRSVIEEKETRIVEILLSTLRPIQLLSGKILAMGVLGIIQVAAWLGTLLILAQIVGGMEDVPGIFSFLESVDLDLVTLLQLVIFFVLGYLFLAAVFGAVGAISVSMTEGPNYATIFTFPYVLPFLVQTQITNDPSGGLATFLSIFPLTSPLTMVMRLALTEVPFAELALSIGLLIIVDLAMIWFAARLFRVNTLLAGQVPKPREILKLLRA